MKIKQTLKSVLLLAASFAFVSQGITAERQDYTKAKTEATTVMKRGVKSGPKGTEALSMVPRLRPGEMKGSGFTATRAWNPKSVQSAPSRITSVEAGKIYGGAIYADNWTSDYQPVGIYSFEKGDGASLEEVMVGDDYIVTGGGCFANGKYHFVSYMSFMGIVLANLYTVDFETWEIERNLPVGVGAVAQDMAYDPTTGNVYGCFMNDEGDGWVFGSLDLVTGERTIIRNLDIIILSIGVSSKGEVYAVMLDGSFCRFDKKTGERTVIGATGRKPVYSASGCFDLENDVFYWECIESDSKANIYTVDLQTGAASYVTTLANNMEMTGMFIPVADAADEAPAAVDAVELDFKDGSLSGAVCFDMPTACFNSEAPLGDDLTWNVAINDSETFSGSAAAGERVEMPYTAAAPGMVKATVYISNEAGRSPVTIASAWVGADIPAAVTGVMVQRTDNPGEILLTWNAPEASAHGGYISADRLTYDVIRMPEEAVVAKGIAETSCSETFDDESDFALHHYVIVPIFDEAAGVAAESPKFPTGSVSLPYANDFDEEDDFSGFMVEDANADGETWTYDAISESARCKYYFNGNDGGYEVHAMDDWLFTPAVRLKAGRMIRFAFDSHAYMYGMNEKAEVKLGKAPASAAMDTKVMAPKTINNTESVTFEEYVTVEEDGIYYFGVHGVSPADQLYLYVDNIRIQEGPLVGTPGAVTKLTAKAANDGSLKVELSFTSPSKTVDGKALESLDKIEIRRNGRLINTIENPGVGEKLTYTDAMAAQGDNLYTVKAINGIGAGYEASASAYAGHDRPGVPVDVCAREENGKVVITWKAPAAGENGGYYDPNALTYTVLRANDEAELAVGLTDLTFTDDNPPLNGLHHEFFIYYVFAESPAGYGYGLASNSVCAGKRFDVPFAESFTNGKLTCGPWDVIIPEESYGWWKIAGEGEYPAALPQDRDGGLVTFMPDEAGDSGKLISGKISMANVEYPTLDFWWYGSTGCSDKIFVYVNADDAGEKMAARVDMGNVVADGWNKSSIDLADFTDAESIQLIFNAVSGDGYSNIHIDNIRIRETYDCNLAVTGFSCPSRMMAGEKSVVTVNVSNIGLNSVTGAEVMLYRNGEQEAAATLKRMLRDDVMDVTFEVVPTAVWGDSAEFQAVVKCNGDENAADDASEIVKVGVTDRNLPAITDLSAERNDAEVTLEWSEPEMMVGDSEASVEDVEGFKAFSIDGFDDWSVIDGDGIKTYGIQDPYTGNMLQYENAGAAMSFMAFNPVLAGLPLEYEDGTPTEFAPHSGDQYFASFAVDGKNDDWLISPLLPGIEQEISFFVRSLTSQYGFEKYEVYYSTTGIEKSDFIQIGDLRSAPIDWVEDKVTLPAGSRYFAIRCVSEDCFLFMLDDITYLAASSYVGELSLMGYNVYRDLQLLTPEPIMEQTYVDTLEDAANHVYQVTAVYDLGESRLSNAVEVSLTGVSAITDSALRVKAEEGGLLISAPTGREVKVFSADGMLMTSFLSDGVRRVSLLPGVYMVASGRSSLKALVK